MDQPAPQFTPAHALDAARRAEMSGRPDYAIQFYRHLIEHHPDTPEGQEARASLSRLTAAGRDGPANALAPLASPQAAPPPAGDQKPIPSSTALARLAYRLEPNSPEPPRPSPTAAEPTPHHSALRLLARLLAGFGLTVMAGGVALPLASWRGISVSPAFSGPDGLALSLAVGMLGAGIGLAMVVAGQLAVTVLNMVRKK